MSKFKPVHIDILCFIIGPVLIVYNLFNFSSGRDFRSDPMPIYYYYNIYTRLLISLGVALVCWGFLRLYWKNNDGINK